MNEFHVFMIILASFILAMSAMAGTGHLIELWIKKRSENQGGNNARN